jgi:uncharacterized protein DUF5680
MDQTALLRFLMDASRHGYAAGRSAVKTREADHSTTIVLEHGEWRLHDNYFGGEPYGGREVVFLGGRPVWMAVYYGQIEDANVDSVYSFLQRALREAPAEFPVRGPEALTEGRFSYRNAHEGGVASFWGQETIHEDGRLVYTARYAGGLVDRQSGD